MHIKRVFHRAVSFALCVLILLICCMSGSAASWVNLSGSRPKMIWTTSGFTSSFSNLYSYLSTGHACWTSGVNNPAIFETSSLSYYELIGYRGGLVHAIPTESFWNNYWGSEGSRAAAVTHAYTPSGTLLHNDALREMDLDILYALIYYNPDPNILSPSTSGNTNGYMPSNYINLVAHETGHALGLTHPPQTVPAIMLSGQNSYTTLSDYDKDFYNRLYP